MRVSLRERSLEYEGIAGGEIGMDQSDISVKAHRLALIAMPAWDVKQPFHALAIVAGIARNAGMPVSVHDINIDFHNLVDEKERATWSHQSQTWMGNDLPRRLWEENSDWLFRELDAIIEKSSPTMIGFSVNMTTRYFSLRAAERIKARRPDIHVLFGGVDCFPGEHHRRFFENPLPCIDIMCTGEAEHAFRDFLLEYQRTGEYATRVPGFIFREPRREPLNAASPASLVDTGDVDVPLLNNEEMPMPAYDLFSLDKYRHKGSLPFYLSRGCIYRCNFCSERPNFRFFRSRRAEEAFAELMHIYPLAQAYSEVPTFSLSDSNFNANKRELERFADLIIAKNLRIKWNGQAHFDEAMTTEFLEKLKRAGLGSVFWGFENASQHVVDLMNKRYAQATARRIIDDCIRLGIRQNLPIIIGYPGETPDDLCETIIFILQYKNRQGVTINPPALLMIRPNAPMHHDFAKHGLANNNYRDWHTADGKNTLHVRIFRRFIAQQAHANPALSMDGIQGLLELPRISVNAHTVSADAYDVLHQLFSRAGTLERFYAIIDEWNKDSSDLGDHAWRERVVPSSAEAISGRRTEYYEKWLLLEKDAEYHRQKVYRTALAALVDLKKVLSCN